MPRKKKLSIKRLIALNLLGTICLHGIIKAETKITPVEAKANQIELDTSYLNSREELKNYILDTGDIIEISFLSAPELTNVFTVNQEGEIFLPKIKTAYVRGLTIDELTELVQKRYEEHLITPSIFIRLIKFKSIRVSIKGEVRNPGLLRLTAVKLPIDPEELDPEEDDEELTLNRRLINSPASNKIKLSNDSITTLSSAISEAGGLTSYSDISQIEIIRDVPIGDGGGKKRGIIDFTSFVFNSDPTLNIRLYDGDAIFIPRLKKADKRILPMSIINGITPRFIKVNISGQIENPGEVTIPLEGSLSDVMNLSGPRKPLSGRIYLIRYNRDGTLLRESIKYSSAALPGSLRNPYLISGDLISVKQSAFGRTSELLRTVTEPFVGIFATKELIEGFSESMD